MGLLKNLYTVFTLDEDVLKVEAGLAPRDILNSVDSYAERSNNYRVEIFVISIKVREDYSNLHLAQLFSCSVSTIANIVTTLIHVIHSIY